MGERRAGGSPSAFGYRPHLDGLRAFAVYLAVGFHTGADRLAGGFIGVDIFFVLSGYLVTHVLVRDLHGSGTVRLVRFYARRARRILPAALVNLVVTAAVFRAIAAPAELEAARGALRAAAVYLSNWWFVRESADYFGAEVAANPVAHYWSLSVEEQFYLAWPLALLGLHRLGARAGRHRHRVVVGAVVAVGIGSAALALLVASGSPERAYYGTDTRTYQLLAGAVLALAPRIIATVGRVPSPRVVLSGGAFAAMGSLVLASSWILEVDPVVRALAATVATVVLVTCLEAAPGGPARRVLALPPLVYLGRVSYGTYLWHWIVILVAQRELGADPLTTLAITVPVATGLASLSYEVLEHPLRGWPRLDLVPRTTVALGLAASLLVGVVVGPGLLDQPVFRPVVAEVAASEGTPNTADWATAKYDGFTHGDCSPYFVTSTCRIVEGSRGRMLLIGDSHAGQLTPLFVAIAQRHDLELVAAYTLYCPWVRGIRYQGVGPDCYEDQQHTYDVLVPDLDPDVVVLVHRTFQDPLNPIGIRDVDEGPLDPRSAAGERAVSRRVRQTVEALRAGGHRVVVVEPTPVSRPDDDPNRCLSEAAVLEACRYVASTVVQPEERAVRDLAEADDGVWSLDLDRAVCPYHPICDPVVGGRVVMVDDNHVTSSFARSLADPVDRWFRENSVLDG